MDTLVAYGSGREGSDNGGEQQEQKQASGEEEDSCKIPGFFTFKNKAID
jgi:hypothetical protein